MTGPKISSPCAQRLAEQSQAHQGPCLHVFHNGEYYVRGHACVCVGRDLKGGVAGVKARCHLNTRTQAHRYTLYRPAGFLAKKLIDQSIHPSIHPSIYPSIHSTSPPSPSQFLASIYLPTHPPNNKQTSLPPFRLSNQLIKLQYHPTYLLAYPLNKQPSYLPACLPACLPSYPPPSLPTYLHTKQPTYQPPYLPPYLPSYLPSYLPASLLHT